VDIFLGNREQNSELKPRFDPIVANSEHDIPENLLNVTCNDCEEG
jgi:hypothetical protein